MTLQWARCAGERLPEAALQKPQAHTTAARSENDSIEGPRQFGVQRDQPWNEAAFATLAATVGANNAPRKAEAT